MSNKTETAVLDWSKFTLWWKECMNSLCPSLDGLINHEKTKELREKDEIEEEMPSSKRRKSVSREYGPGEFTRTQKRFGVIISRNASQQFLDGKDYPFQEKLTVFPIIEQSSNLYCFFDFILRRNLGDLFNTKKKSLTGIRKLELRVPMEYFLTFWDKPKFKYITTKK